MRKNFIQKKPSFQLKPACAAVLLAFSVQQAAANPVGGAVVSGQASFNTTGSTLTVTNTPGAIINWQGFSIQQTEITRFAQQSASSAVLNRVITNNPSLILGTLQSNGRVFLVNHSGIVFGAGSTVDVAGLVATSLNISDADFQAGHLNFTQVPGAQAVSNAGNITAQSGGEIYLIAPNVENSGVITAPNGEILLAAGHEVQLVNTLDPNLRVNITAAAGNATNVGQLVASAGRLGLFGTVVRNSGTVSANSATLQGGKIVFKASQRVEAGGVISAQGVGGGDIKILADMQSGTVNVSGTLDASAPVSGNGGFIDTSAAHVQVADNARITTAAANGNSGNWLIDPTDFTIAAVDPLNGSSHMSNTTLATSLDSGNVIIQTLAAGAGSGDIFVNDAIAKTGIPVTTLTLLAHNNIIVAPSVAISSTGGALNVLFNADTDGLNGGAISMATGSSIVSNGGNVILGGGVAGNGTGKAAGNATYANGIDILGASINSGAGNITLNGQGDGLGGLNMGVYLHSGASLTTTSGTVTINGTGGGDGTLGSNRGVRIASLSTITTGTGNIGITGQGGWDGDGIQVVGGSQVKSTSGGLITLTGTTGLGTGLDYGIYLSDAGTLVETGGNILFTGVSNSVAGTDNKGIALYEVTTPLTTGPKVSALGTGNITFNGTGGGGTNFSSGMTISGSEVTVADGTITLNGTSGSATGTDSRGVNLHDGAWVHATGLGSISITGVAVNSATASLGSGVRVALGAIVQTASGAINITGSGTNGTDSNYGVLITDALSAVKSASGAVSITGSGWGTGIGNYGVYIDAGGTVGTNSTAKLLANRDIYINSALTNSTGGSLVLNADMNGTGVGTVTFGASGSIALSGGGRADLYYNPLSYSDVATKSDALTNPYSTKITGLYTAWMLVNNVTNLQAMSTNLAGNYALGAAIDASGTTTWNFNGTTYDGFAPIGDNVTSFTGKFNGNLYNISGLYINRPNASYVGLFGRTNASTIKDVSLTDVNITGGNYVGSLVGWHQGSITNCSNLTLVTNANTVTGGGFSGYTGGLIGMNYNGSTVSNSSAGATVSGTSYVGGLIGGSQQSTLTNVSATGNVTGTNWGAGGLVGSLDGDLSPHSLTNGTASGNVSGSRYVGGLVGWNGYWSTINNGIASGNVVSTGTDPYNSGTGGLVGMNAYSITGSHATGNVSGFLNVGGLVGSNTYDNNPSFNYTYGSIASSDATLGTVTGVTNVGGLVGYNALYSVFYNNTINNSNAGGAVTGNSNVGGLVGQNDRGSISTVYATGSVTGNGVGSTSLGGLVGNNSGTITNAYATSVSVTGVNNVGGLVGYNWLFSGYSNDISGSYVSAGSVTGTSNYGGLVGNNSGTLTNSHYNINGVTINGANIVSLGGLYNDNTFNAQSKGQYDDWFIGKALNIADYTVGSGGSTFGNGGVNIYTISNAQGLKDMLGFADNALYTFTLNAANVDLAGLGNFYIPLLAADFNGAGNTISNLNLNQANSNLGMFGKIASTGSVSNLTLQNAVVNAGVGGNVGGLAGSNAGAISNVTVNTSVAGNASVAGVSNIGGLVGNNAGSIISGSVDGSAGTVSVTGVNSVGGLAGTNSSSISTSFVTGATVAGASNIGGMVGNNVYLGSISDSYVSSGAVTATVHNVGGLVGFENGGMRNNSHFNIDAVTTNGGNNVTVAGLYATQYNDWFAVGALTPLAIGSYASLALQVDGSYGINSPQGMKDMLGFADDPLAYNFKLTGAINLFTLPGFYVPKLVGSFNGNNLTISNLSLTLPNYDMGLFGVTSQNSVVNNLGLVNARVNGYGNVGGLVGSNYGNIDNVSVAVNAVNGISAVNNNVGGLVGQNFAGSSFTASGAATTGVISNSFVSGGTVTGNNDNVGGLAGYNYGGDIKSSHVTGTAVSGANNVGGLVGNNQAFTSWSSPPRGGNIANSYVSGGSVTGTGTAFSSAIGGLIGLNFDGDISASYVLNANVNGGLASMVGGLVGSNKGRTVSYWSWNGFSSVLVTSQSGTISNSYVSSGTVTSTGNDVGGLVGNNWGASIDFGSVDNVAVTGKINVGGLVGNDSGEGSYGNSRLGTISNSHTFNTQVTGESHVGGLIGNITQSASGWYASYDAVFNSYVDLGTVTGNAITGGALVTGIGGLVGHNGYGNISSSYVTNGTVVSGGVASNVGGLVGYNIGSSSTTWTGQGYGTVYRGSISNSYVSGGTVSGDVHVGGLVGNNASFGFNDIGYIDSSYALTTSVTGRYAVGGLVGSSDGSVTNSYVINPTVMATSSSSSVWAGGLVGRNYGSISNSYVSGGTVRALNFASDVGGLVGNNSGSIYNGYASGVAVSASNSVGGLVGDNSGSISNSYVSNGSVTGIGRILVAASSSDAVGGLVGLNSGLGIISNSYVSNGTISNTLALGAGGLVGRNFATVNNSYISGGSVNATYSGGLAFNNSGTFTNSFWDSNTTVGPWSDDPWGGGGTLTNSTGIAGMLNKTTLIGLGFDFTNTWWMIDGNTLPFLQSEYSTTITNAHQLQLIGMDATTLAASYMLANNIDLAPALAAGGMWSGAGFVPVGSTITSFTGQFDGQGNTISNLTINRPTEGFVGLFGFMSTATAAVSNVGLVNSSVTGLWTVGSLAGYSGGSITNSYASGISVSGSNTVGGLVGQNGLNSSISNSYVDSGSVSGTGNGVGGLAGLNDAIITNSYASGITVSGVNSVGGLVGNNEWSTSNISNSYASNVSVTGALDAGGLVGLNDSGFGAIVSNSFWNKTTAGAGVSFGIGNDTTLGAGTDSGAVGLTSAQMMQQSSFTGWNFTTVWRSYNGHSAPLLKSFLKPVTVTASGISGNFTKTFDGVAWNSPALGTITYSNPAATGLLNEATPFGAPVTNVGSYEMFWSGQQGYDISYTAGGMLTITPASVSVKANDASKTYGATLTFAGTEFTPVGLLGGDTIGSVTLTSAGAVNTANVGAYAITSSNTVFSVGSAANYTITYVDGTLTVTAAPLTVSASGVNRFYNGTTVASVNLSDTRLAGDVLTASYGAANFQDKNIGTTKQVDVTGISLSGIDAGNYTFNTTAMTFADISAAALIVTGIPKNKVLGTSDPLLTYMVTGLYDPISSVLTGELARDLGESIGTYRVNQGSLALLSTNYTLSYVPCNFNILAPTVVQEITEISLLDMPKDRNTLTSDEEEERLAEEAIASSATTAEGIISGAEGQLPVCR